MYCEWLKQRLHATANQKAPSAETNDDRDQRTATADLNPTQKWYTIPYIRTVSEGTGRMLAKYGIRVAHKPTKTLCSQLMLAKGPLKDDEKSGVAYRVNCEECSSYYVGETW